VKTVHVAIRSILTAKITKPEWSLTSFLAKASPLLEALTI